jgi:Uma2 family endonuclease
VARPVVRRGRHPLCYRDFVHEPRPTKRNATYEDLCRVPDHLVAEILDGELIVTPRPTPRHAHVGSVLVAELVGPFGQGRGGPGGWWILYEPELHLGEDVVVPDIAGWRRERLAAVPDSAFFTLAPDWVCEILSPSTERTDRLRKLSLYARERVSHAWLVNPALRTLEIFCLENARWVVVEAHGDEEAVRAEPFDAIAIDLRLIWPDPPATGS